jgi:hypothetical protein
MKNRLRAKEESAETQIKRSTAEKLFCVDDRSAGFGRWMSVPGARDEKHVRHIVGTLAGRLECTEKHAAVHRARNSGDLVCAMRGVSGGGGGVGAHGYGVGDTVGYGVGGTVEATSVGVRPLALVCVENARARGTREFEDRRRP